MMPNLTVLKDPKKDIEFWLNALSNENISHNNKALLNKCLESELNLYLQPYYVSKIVVD